MSKKYGDYDDFSENLKYGLLNVSIAEGDKPIIKTLIPDDEINKKEGEYKIDTSIWVVEGANKNETWIKCEYRNTSIVLVKKYRMASKIVVLQPDMTPIIIIRY